MTVFVNSLILLDGAHLYSPLGGVYLALGEKDANEQLMCTGLMTCPKENKKYWLNFYTRCKELRGGRMNLNINDADKGSLAALDELDIPSATCVRHICGNAATRFPGSVGAGLKRFIYGLGMASTWGEYEGMIASLKAELGGENVRNCCCCCCYC